MIEFIPKVNDFCINRRSVDYLFPDMIKMRFIWVSMYLARKLLIGDTIRSLRLWMYCRLASRSSLSKLRVIGVANCTPQYVCAHLASLEK